MKIVKQLIVVAMLFMGLFQTVNAQDILSAEHQEQVAENVENFIYDLNLSERDKPAFKDIMSDFFVGLTALRATNFSMETNKKIMKALIQGRDDRVKGVLSADQFKVYQARAKERQAKIKDFMKEQKKKQ